MEYNEKKLFLIKLSKSVAVRKSEPTDANTGYLDVQQRIDKVWRVYGVGDVYDLLLDMSMSDDERKLVLKQLGHKHEIDALIYVGTKKNYGNEERRNDDVRRIFSAIEDKRRNRLLSDIFKNKGSTYYTIGRFNELMKVLKASLEYNEIADMLLGVKGRCQATVMIREISIQHGYKYVANILLSIDDNGLKSMIANLIEYWEVSIPRILNIADEVGKLSRLFNIIVSLEATEEYIETLLVEFVINDSIFNELIDKPEEEQNEILKVINSKKLVDKIKYAILAQLIRRESPRDILNRCDLDNIPQILDSSNYEELEKHKAYTKEAMRILKILFDLIVTKGLIDSNALKMLISNDNGHDAQTNELDRVFETREDIIEIIETIKRKIPGMEERMNKNLCEMVCNVILGTRKMDDYSIECLYELVSVMDGMMSKAEGLKWEYKELYDQVVMLCNEIKKNILINLMESIRMLPIANTIILEIYEAVRHNECANRSEYENNSTSDPSKFMNEMLNKMKFYEWERMIYIVVEKVCKEQTVKDYDLSKEGDKEVKQAIKALPYLITLINNSKSNMLNNNTNVSPLVLLILLILASMYNSMISQTIEDKNKLMSSSEVHVQHMEVDNESSVWKMLSV
ncbi:hypothetical protein HK407_09g15520, partial [Ordospora pajunii]|uniref:uncharacterized protein n=1 Tax=Ordospora pajunii TaxID=3039483 RepID=UPI002952671B